MPRFAANLSTLFTEAPLLERFERAARAGFSTVEMQFPYEAPAAVAVRHLPRAALRGRVGGDDKQDPGAHRPHPGRRQSGGNEPGTGEINDPFLFEHLDRIGYQGWIGCEYKAAGSTEAGLGWLEQARSTLRATS